MNLGDYSGWWARMRGDERAAIFENRALSWRELDAQAGGVAAALQALGVARGDRVGVLLGNCMEWYVAYIAAFKAGAILVPLNPGYGDAELREIAAQAECRVLVSKPALMRRLSAEAPESDAAVRLYPRDGAPLGFAQAAASGARPREVRVAGDDVAVISFTSGSTGLPKGVMLTHHNICAVSTSVMLEHRWTSHEQVLLLAPFAFTGGVIVVLTPTYLSGACLHIEAALDAAGALERIRTRRITSLTAVPIFYERIAAVPGFSEADISSLRLAISGGAPVSAQLLRSFAAKGVCLRQTYGCTEGCGFLSAPTEADARAHPELCGWPLPTVQLRVVDDEGRDCAANEAGEIWLRGAQVTKGYWRNPRADAEAFADDWYKTGDLGSLDELGRLRILDRKKSMIISGGVNVYPAEVERAIGAIPGIAEVLCFGRPDAEWGERVVAAVFGPQPLDPAALLAECKTRLGSYKAPKEIIVSAKPLPRTSTGKLPRSKLDALYAALADQPRATADAR